MHSAPTLPVRRGLKSLSRYALGKSLFSLLVVAPLGGCYIQDMPERSIENFSSGSGSATPEMKRAAAVLAVGSLGAGSEVDGNDLSPVKCLKALRWMHGILVNSPLISEKQIEALDFATKAYADRVATGTGDESSDASDSEAPRAERVRTSLSCIRQLAPGNSAQL